jgi:hypothetical protein
MKVFPLGRNKSVFDKNDYNLKDFIPRNAYFTTVSEKNWEFPVAPLNQEETPHCTGFSMANFGINYPTSTLYTDIDAHSFYYKCKEMDGEPNQENGSSIRTVAKVLKNTRRVSAYAFAPDMATIKWWLLNKGPLIVGTTWTSDMFIVKKDNTINIGDDIVGGHAYLLNEWRSDNYIGIQNSWGYDWGKNGKAYISASDFEKLFVYDGEALTAVELDSDTEVTTPHSCILIDIINNIFGMDKVKIHIK